MRIGSIDIGTNTILLTIVENKNNNLKILRDEHRIPRIGKNLSFTKNISDDSISDLIQILIDYKSICERENVEKIICAGTAPFRIALNSEVVINKVFEQTGLIINVLSSKEEAILTYLGGISNFNEFFCKKNFVVIDIGGGSTELTYGNIHDLFFNHSYEIGAVILKDKFFNSFPYKFDIKIIENYLNKIFNDSLNFNDFITIAVAGTPTTVASIKLEQIEFDESKVDKLLIKRDYLIDLIQKLYELSPERILNTFPSVINGREDVLLPGTLILYNLLKKINAEDFYVSVRGVRFGLIIKELMFQVDGFWTNVGLRKFLSSLNG